MGDPRLRRTAQDDRLRLRGAGPDRAALVCARACDPAIARVEHDPEKWMPVFGKHHAQATKRRPLFGDRTIAVVEERHAEAEPQLVDRRLVLLDDASEQPLPLL